MQLTAFILSWVKRVVTPLVGRDRRPLALRATLPDQSRPTVPERLVRPTDMRAVVAVAQTAGANNCAK